MVACLDGTLAYSKIHVGEIQQNLKRVNAYRNYRLFNLDLFPCKENFLVQAWVKPDDARHGLISGKIIVGETTAVESYHDLINYFINGILLMFAVMAIPLLIIMKWLRELFKIQDDKKDLFLMITYWLLTSLFISGLVMIVFPFSEAQSFYRRLLNIIFCFSRLVTLAYYTKQIDENSALSRILDRLKKSPFKTKNLLLGSIFSPGMLFSIILLSAGKNYQFNYVYFTLALDVLCLILSLKNLPFFFYSIISLLSNLKLLNQIWAPESATGLFFIFSISIYEIAILIQNETSKTLFNFINNTTHDQKFSAQVAHDIRSPLGVLKMLIEQVDWKSNQEEIKSTVYSSLNKISVISKSLTENKTLPKNESCDLTQLIEAIKTVEKEYGRENFVKLTMPNAATDYKITMDEVDLYRVVQNLIKNSMEVENVSHISIEVKESKNTIEISVKNNGKLPTDQIIKTILEEGGSFGKIGGSGIGLNYCKYVMAKIDGRFNFRRKNENIIASVYIPRKYKK